MKSIIPARHEISQEISAFWDTVIILGTYIHV